MSSRVRRRAIVHITPFAWEVDRAVEVAHEARADHVFLIGRTGHPLSNHFRLMARERLERFGIAAEFVNVSDEDEFRDVLRFTSFLIRSQAHQGNRVEVNSSAGGKMAAVAAALAAMYHHDRCELFRASPMEYVASMTPETPEQSASEMVRAFRNHGLTRGVRTITRFPRFPMQRPALLSEWALAALSEGPKTYAELGESISRLPINQASQWAHGGRTQEANAARLRRSVIAPLEELGLVRRVQDQLAATNRKTVELTGLGSEFVLITGLLDMERKPKPELVPA